MNESAIIGKPLGKVSQPPWTAWFGVFLCIALLGCDESRSHARVDSGVLDLSGERERLEEDVAELDGTWLFRWQEFLEPASFRDGPPVGMLAMEVPAIWNGKLARGDSAGLSGEGFATYAMQLHLPSPPPNASWALMVEEVSTAYAMYAVTPETVTLVAKNGRVGQSSSEHISQWAPRVGLLPETSDGKLWLVLHVSNFSYARGGAWTSILVSTPNRLERALAVRDLFSAGLLGILLVMALYHLARYLLRASDLGSAWFALLCILVFAREFSISRMSDYFAYVPTDAIFTLLLRLEFMSFFIGGPAVMSFIGIVFPSSYYRRLTRLNWLVSLPYFLVALFLSSQAMSTVLKSYYFVMSFQIIVTLVYLVHCVVKRKTFAWLALIGCLVMAVGAIHDMLYSNGYDATGFWATYCFGFFILIKSYLLAAQSTHQFNQVERARLANLDKIKAQLDSSRLEQELSGALKTKIHIFSNVAHELNNPLNYVSLGVDASSKHLRDLKTILDPLFEGAEQSDEGKRIVAQVDNHFDGIEKNLDIIVSGSTVAANVIAEMRGLAEIDGTVREELRVRSLLEGCMRRVRADQRPEVLEQVHFEEDLKNSEQAVEGNPYMLIHAISHVLINAVRYCVQSAEKPTVWLESKLTDSHWILSIQNNGPPIHPSAIQTLLLPGQTGEKVRNLPVTLALLKEQGARMRLCDTGQITGRVIFEIELPLVGVGNMPKTFEEP